MKKYTIKSGNHYEGFGIHIGITFKSKIIFKAKFDKSCLYDLKNKNNYDINKLFGFSTTYWHHNQSARVGWRRHDDYSLEILTYSYNNHKRVDETILGIVKPDKIFTCTIEDIETSYVYTFNDGNEFKRVYDPKLKDNVLFKYLLYPYFGGDEKAPNDMIIYLEKI